jgi:DNA-binding transcriptional MerR regulator
MAALDSKAPDAFRTISEVAEELDLPQHVLRFWETRFREIKPMKRGGGRRYYRPDDIGLLRGIRHLLYGEGYTIRGVQRILREHGIKFVQEVWQEGAVQPPDDASDVDDVAEDAASAAGMAGEENGLRGRLTSLIGRDLDDKRDAAERREPPLESAPEPWIDSQDRSGHVPAAPEPVPPASPTARALEASDRAKLEAVLSDLAACRKLIEAAVARPE